jgi:hypothetical protein
MKREKGISEDKSEKLTAHDRDELLLEILRAKEVKPLLSRALPNLIKNL